MDALVDDEMVDIHSSIHNNCISYYHKILELVSPIEIFLHILLT